MEGCTALIRSLGHAVSDTQEVSEFTEHVFMLTNCIAAALSYEVAMGVH